jgi:hypothetical protein
LFLASAALNFRQGYKFGALFGNVMVPLPAGADANSGMMAAQGGKDMGYKTANLWVSSENRIVAQAVPFSAHSTIRNNL